MLFGCNLDELAAENVEWLSMAVVGCCGILVVLIFQVVGTVVEGLEEIAPTSVLFVVV